MDESGHDHRTMPYEVRGGVALHATNLWPFVQAMRALEESAFGDQLQRYKIEIKGHSLLDKHRFKWASQDGLMEDVARRKHAIAFLNRGKEKQSPNRAEFTAYGQACLMMARGIFELLTSHGCRSFCRGDSKIGKEARNIRSSRILAEGSRLSAGAIFLFSGDEKRSWPSRSR